MMRIEDSREAGLRNASKKYSSLETIRHVSEFDFPVGKRSRGKKRGYAVCVCVVLVFLAVIVSVTVVIAKTTVRKVSKVKDIQNESQCGLHDFAPAPGPQGYTGLGAIIGWESSSPAPAVDASELVAPLLFSPLSSVIPIGPAPSAGIDPSSASQSLDLAPYETICNKTINRIDCLNMFWSNPRSHEGDLKQWTVTAMEAAEHALNESYIVAQGMKKEHQGNVALQQCIDVFADALGNVNTSIILMSTMDSHNPGTTGDDVQTFMSAAMTDYDTCGEGIEDVGSFPGSDKITGQKAKHVDTMLSIALTFVNHLITATVDRMFQGSEHR